MSTTTRLHTGSIHTWGDVALPFQLRFCEKCGDVLPGGICARCGGNFCPLCGATEECPHRLPEIDVDVLPYLAEGWGTLEDAEDAEDAEDEDLESTSSHREDRIVAQILATDVLRDYDVRAELRKLRQSQPTLFDSLLGGVSLRDIAKELWPRAAIVGRTGLCCVTVTNSEGHDVLGLGSVWYATDRGRIVAALDEILGEWNAAIRSINDVACGRGKWKQCPFCGFVDPRGHLSGLLSCIACGAWECPYCGPVPPRDYGLSCEHTLAMVIDGVAYDLAIDPRPIPRSRLDEDFLWQLEDGVIEREMGPFAKLIGECYQYIRVSTRPSASLFVHLAEMDRDVFQVHYYDGNMAVLDVVFSEDPQKGAARLLELLEELRQRFARLDALYPEHIVAEED